MERGRKTEGRSGERKKEKEVERDRRRKKVGGRKIEEGRF